MDKFEDKVRLIDLAKALGLQSAAIRQHYYHNKGGLADGARKFGERQTGDILLSIDSVLSFLNWLSGKTRKVTQEAIENVRKELNARR